MHMQGFFQLYTSSVKESNATTQQEDEASVDTFVPPNAAYVSDASIEEPARATDEHAPAERAPKMRFRFAAEGTA